MVNLQDSVRAHCAGIEPDLLDLHFRRMSSTYFDRYSAAEIARHVRLLASLGNHAVEVEMRPLAAHTFELLTVGVDHPGTLACITAALAAYGFDVEDVQVSSYFDQDPGGPPEPTYFVIVLCVSGSLPTRSVPDFVADLRDRLRSAFALLAQGNLLEAQTVAADTRLAVQDVGHATPHRGVAAAPRPTGFEGMVFGGDFRLDRKLAMGGMSEVYVGTQVSLNRTVAVKLFRHDNIADDELLARFNREAVVLAQFSCPYIVQILAAGTAQERHGGTLGWMAMEYMAGGDLARRLRDLGPPPCELAVRWLRQALEGLHYAHRHGVLHRDLKPHNLLLTSEGDLKVSDFGLLKQSQAPITGLTPRSAVLGTPQYMSPEQALGEPLDERSDIFSLGTAFYHLLAGRLPFERATATALLIAVTQQDAPRLAEVGPHVPAPLALIVQRMLARRREERYQDVGVILEDLGSYERRGLLHASEAPFAQVPPVVPDLRPGEPTQAYQPPPSDDART